MDFNIEKQYQLFLNKMALDEATMHQIQKVQTRRAFMGGFSQAMLLMTSEVVNLSEEDAMVAITDLMDQVQGFWIKQK
jgi:hypothetical protein